LPRYFYSTGHRVSRGDSFTNKLSQCKWAFNKLEKWHFDLTTRGEKSRQIFFWKFGNFLILFEISRLAFPVWECYLEFFGSVLFPLCVVLLLDHGTIHQNLRQFCVIVTKIIKIRINQLTSAPGLTKLLAVINKIYTAVSLSVFPGSHFNASLIFWHKDRSLPLKSLDSGRLLLCTQIID
jgi:hypothetical protein